MLPDRLQNAEGPAEALAHQSLGVDGGFGEGQRAVLVDHLEAQFKQRHGQVGVLGDGVDRVAAGGLDGACAPCADGSGNHNDDVKQIKSPALEVLAGDIFEGLPASPEVDAVADFGVSGDGADQRVFKVRNELADGVGGDDGVGVDADVKLLRQAVEGEVQRGGLASVGLAENLNAAGGYLGGVSRARDLGGAVAGAVVDDHDMKVGVVGVEHRADGADNDLFLVVGGDEDGDAGIEAGRSHGVGAEQAVDDGEDAHQDQPRAHQNVAQEEDQHNELADDGHAGEGDGVRQGAQVLAEGQLGHHLGGGLVHQLGDGDDGVAIGAQGVDQRGQCGHGGGAVAAAVVQQDDGAAELRLDLHGLQLFEDGLGDLGGRLARMLVPVVGVQLVADDGVAGLLDALHRGGLVVRVRLLVDVVRRTEIERLNAQLAGEEALGQLEFEVKLAVGDFADVGMAPGVVADLMALAHHPFHHAHILRGLCADQHEGSLGVLVAQNIQYLGRPFGVGSVVEGERDFVGVVAVLLDGVGARVDIHVLIDDELLARI